MTNSPVELTLSADDGELLDGTLDDGFCFASENLQPERVAECSRIRHLLWDQNSQQTGHYSLSAGDWRIVLRELREPVGETDIAADLELLVTTIETALH